MKYRPEIDGLRALAVIPVVFYHAGFDFFTGGFVGVDVFFVISGYLITGILVGEIRQDNFTLIGFYERRARRILPPLLFVAFCCLPFAWTWLTPEDMKDFSQSLIGVATFSSNILFWFESGYFATEAELKPLLHTWSLAVEEQYYLLYPIVLMSIFRYQKKGLIPILMVAALASFAFAQWCIPRHPGAAFFSLPTRAWELLIGGLCVLCPLKHHLFNHQFVRGSASLMGLCLIGISILIFNESTPTPGIQILMPVLGAVLLIYFATAGSLVYGILSWKPVVGVGLISYSIYLWHQPIFSFYRYRHLGQENAIHLVALTLLTTLLAYFSWLLIERNFRNKKKFNRRQIFSYAAICLIALSAVGALGWQTEGYKNRHAYSVTQLEILSENHIARRQAACSPVTGASSALAGCVVGAEDNIVGVLLGDSHAQMLWESLNDTLEEQGVGLLSFAHGGCPPIRGIYRRDLPGTDICYEYNEQVWSLIKAIPEIDVVVLSARWTIYVERTRYDNGEGGVESGTDAYVDLVIDGEKVITEDDRRREQVLAQYRQGILDFLATGKEVILVFPVPEVGWNVPRTLIQQHIYGLQVSDSYLSHDHTAYRIRNKRILDTFHSIQPKKNLERIDVSSFLCNTYVKHRCISVLDGVPLYSDDDHLFGKSAEFVTGRIIDRMTSRLHSRIPDALSSNNSTDLQ